MGKKKKDTIELRFYEVPQNEYVLALLGEDWIRDYGHDEVNLHFHNLMEIGFCRNDSESRSFCGCRSNSQACRSCIDCDAPRTASRCAAPAAVRCCLSGAGRRSARCRTSHRTLGRHQGNCRSVPRLPDGG